MAVKVTLQSNALITADYYRDYKGGVSQGDQERLHNLINIVSDFIEAYCNRNFVAQKYWHEEHKGQIIKLRHWPLLNLASIYSGADFESTTGSVDSGSTTTMVDSNRTEADDYWNGASIQVETSSGTWEEATVTDFVASTDTITFSPAMSAAPASGESYRLALKKTSTHYLLTDSDYIIQDVSAGMIKLKGSWPRLLVTYTGGYNTVPSDLKLACVWLVSEAFKPESQGGGPGSVFRQISEREQELPAKSIVDSLSILNKYRIPRVG